MIKSRVLVGSVYIPPGDFKALELLDKVIGNITLSHEHTIIGMLEPYCGTTNVLVFHNTVQVSR